MARLRLAFAVLALALAGSATPAAAIDCYSAVYHPDHGTCGFTGRTCNAGKGCLYDCEFTGDTCITWTRDN